MKPIHATASLVFLAACGADGAMEPSSHRVLIETKTPVLQAVPGDWTGDGDDEVVVREERGLVHIVDLEGEVLDSFEIDTSALELSALDGEPIGADERFDRMVVSRNIAAQESGQAVEARDARLVGSLFDTGPEDDPVGVVGVWDANGQLLWSVETSTELHDLRVGDINGDGRDEVVYTDGRVVVRDLDGALVWEYDESYALHLALIPGSPQSLPQIAAGAGSRLQLLRTTGEHTDSFEIDLVRYDSLETLDTPEGPVLVTGDLISGMRATDLSGSELWSRLPESTDMFFGQAYPVDVTGDGWDELVTYHTGGDGYDFRIEVRSSDGQLLDTMDYYPWNIEPSGTRMTSIALQGVAQGNEGLSIVGRSGTTVVLLDL